jgi:hypothetical protein
MAQRSANWLATASLIFLSSCDGRPVDSTAPPGYVEPPSTDHLPLADHPEYVAWSRFAVGASVVRKKEVSNDSGTVRVTTTLRLAHKSEEKVIIESQVMVDRQGHPPLQNPPLKLEFSAKFPLPPGMTIEQFSLPSLRARLAAEETQQVCGREVQTLLFTWSEVNEAGPMAVHYWRSDEVPGRMVRQEINGRTQTSVEEIVDISEPGSR